MISSRLSRRTLIGAGASTLLAGIGVRQVWAEQTLLAATPRCSDGDEPTPRQTEGPYFTPNSPKRRNLAEEGMPGTRIELGGFVVDRGCKPVPNALLDLWHCDATGEYDNQGYRLRGHQFTDAKGFFGFESIMPGLYPGRTQHFHVKVQAPGRGILTTQLYFPDEPANASDGIFDEALLLHIGFPFTGPVARYDFVLDLG